MTVGQPHLGLAAIESFFGAGVSAAPIEGPDGAPGAMLFRYLPKFADPWSNGLHLDAAPDAHALRGWLSTWQAFEAPGMLRWEQPAGTPLDQGVVESIASAGFAHALRTVSRWHAVGSTASGRSDDTPVSAPVSAPAGVTLAEVEHDAYDWAAFEVLARWIDRSEEPDTWRWRANRVRHLVEGGRGHAWLARIPSAPVGAAVLLDPPDHRPGAEPVAAAVVHAAHRNLGIARHLLAPVVGASARPTTAPGHPQRAGEVVGGGALLLGAAGHPQRGEAVATVVEVGRR